MADATIIETHLRWRSTNVPNMIPNSAEKMANAPPITDVASTDRVWRYTQNVTANHRKLVITPLMRALTRSRWKVFIGGPA